MKDYCLIAASSWAGGDGAMVTGAGGRYQAVALLYWAERNGEDVQQKLYAAVGDARRHLMANIPNDTSPNGIALKIMNRGAEGARKAGCNRSRKDQPLKKKKRNQQSKRPFLFSGPRVLWQPKKEPVRQDEMLNIPASNKDTSEKAD
jgi:hypothetical protein